MFTIRYATADDLPFWKSLDRHIPEGEICAIFAARRGYLALEDGTPVGILRYGLFWDSIPFLNMLYFTADSRRKGYGKRTMAFWEEEMRGFGYKYVMSSTQADEQAQFFFRELGYKDAGCLILDLPGLSQPAEIFLIKAL